MSAEVPTEGRDARSAARPPRGIDVARRAGVSRTTVSHILNGNSARFSEDTIEKVRVAAAEMGYVPSVAGRALVRGRSDIVLIVVPFTTLPNLQEIVEVLTEELATHGLNALVQLSGPVGSESHRRLRAVVDAMRPAGIVDLGGLSEQDHDELQQRCPVVGTAVDEHGAASNLALGRIQVEHLVATGRRRIAYAFLSDARGHPFDQLRVEGARAACREHELADPYLFGLPLDSDGARDALNTVLKSLATPIGVACFSDEVATGVVFAAGALGLDVPDDIAVVGMGRSALGQLQRPRLTTISLDIRTLLRSVRSALAVEYEAEPPDHARLDLGSLSVVQGETT